MASLFKPTYSVPVPNAADLTTHKGKPHVRVGKAAYPLTADGTKYLKPAGKWYGKYTDGSGAIRKVPLSSDKSAAKLMLAELVKKAERQRNGLFDPAEDHARRPLAAHLADYTEHLTAKGDSPVHVDKTRGQILAILDGCGFDLPKDLDATKVTEWLNARRRAGRKLQLPADQAAFSASEAAEAIGITRESVVRGVRRLGLTGRTEGGRWVLPRETVEALAANGAKGVSPETSNHYIRAIRGFCRWLVRTKRVGANPLDTLSLMNTASDIRHARRELSGDELQRLLTATRNSPVTLRELDGEARYFLYLTAVVTGFRASALAHLTPADFQLDATPPTVTLAARWNKSRKTKVQPLPADAAAELAAYLAKQPAVVRCHL